MHRTDAPQFEPDIGTGVRGFQESIPANETIVAAAFMNAVQEELIGILDAGGVTPRASSALDTANQWGQVAESITRMLMAKSIITLGADNTGVVDAGPIINNALLSNLMIYVPEGTYLIDTNLVIPTGASILGAGSSKSLFKIKTSTRLSITDSMNLKGIGIFTNDAAVPQGADIALSSLSHKVVFDDVEIYNFSVNLKIYSTGLVAHRGNFIGNNISLKTPDGVGGWNLAINVGPASAYGLENISITNLKNICTLPTQFNTVVNTTTPLVGGPVNISHSWILGGIFYAANRCGGFVLHNSHLSLDEVRFEGAYDGMFKNNHFIQGPPTVNNNYAGSPSAWQWWDNPINVNTTVSPIYRIGGTENYRGIFTRRQPTSTQAVLNGGIDKLDLGSVISTKMAFNPTYTYDTTWNAGTKSFVVRGRGDGKIRIRLVLDLLGTTITTPFNVQVVVLNLAITQEIYIPVTYFTTASKRIILSGYVEFPCTANDEYYIQIANFCGETLTVQTGSFVEVEGL